MYKISILTFMCTIAVITSPHALARSASSTSVDGRATATSSGVIATTTVATTTVATTTINTASSTPSQALFEARVREYFADIPVMIDIAKCESSFRQFTDMGNVMRDRSGQMVGIFQFFKRYHASDATRLGFNITTVEGNLGYARHLYQQQGTAPWRSCVPATPLSPVTPTTTTLNNEQLVGLMKQVIVLLQELLKLKLAQANTSGANN